MLRLACLYIFFSLITNAFSQTHLNDLKIISSSSENWSPGATLNNKRGGTNYSIKLVVTSKSQIQLEEVVIHDLRLPFEVIKDGKREVIGKFSYGDTLLLISRQNNSESHPKSIGKKIVVGDYPGYIMYKRKRKTFYTPITEFTESKKKQANQ